MKKKIMAFLLAATMVVGSATTASAATLNGINDDELFRSVTVKGIDSNREENKNLTFMASGFDFKNATMKNDYTAVWASQKDEISKAIVSAWQNGQKVMRMTSAEQQWESNGAWMADEKLLDGSYYGSWINYGWDKTKSQAVNMGLNTTDGTGIDYDNIGGVFAKSTSGKAVFRPGYGVILASSLQKVIDKYNEAEAMYATDHEKAADLYAAAKALATPANVVSTDVEWAKMDQTSEIVAFVNYENGYKKTYTAAADAANLTSMYTDYGAVTEKMTDGLYDAIVKYSDGNTYYYDVVSPYEALYTANIWTGNWGFQLAMGAQVTDVYEVMVGKVSLDDANFKCATEEYLNAGQSADPKVDKIRLWRWNNAMAREQWVERHASYETSKGIVEQAWKNAISGDLIKAYNVAAEKAGLTALNDDAKVGDVYVIDIKKLSGSGNTYTLVQGQIAKNLTDKAKAVKVLHWVNNKEWKAVDAEAVRLYTYNGADSYGVLMTENTYSPFVVIEIEDEGTVADATADAAKTPEKSGKTGVSFLGL